VRDARVSDPQATGASEDATIPATPPPELSFTARQLQHRAIKGAYWTLLSTVIGIPLAFVVNVFLARILGPVDYGRLAYLTTVMTIAGSILSIGIGTGVVQFGTKAHSLGKQQQVKDLLSTSQAYHLFVVGPVLMVIVLVMADVRPAMLIVALVFGILLPSILGSATYCFGIENKTAQDAQNTILVNFLTQAAVVGAILFFRSADAVWAARLILGGVGTGLALFYVAPAYRRAVLRPRFRKLPAGFWKFALPAGAAAALGTMVSSRIEVVVLTWMSAGSAAGLFALAFGVAGHLFGPAQALVGPLIPAVSSLHEVDQDTVGRALARTLRASSTAVALIVAGGVSAFAFLMPLVYGNQYHETAQLLIVLGMASGLLVIASPLKAFSMARLAGTRLLVINASALLVDLVVMITLVPVLGVWAAIIGNAAASVTQIGYVLVGESVKFGLSAMHAVRGFAPFLLGCLSCVGVWYGVSALGWDSIPSAIVAGFLGVGLVTLLLRLLRLGLTTGDADAITRALPRALRGIGGLVLRLCAGERSETA
jgi:O-antigen/teichoic acid export membrane protein